MVIYGGIPESNRTWAMVVPWLFWVDVSEATLLVKVVAVVSSVETRSSVGSGRQGIF